jgi:hypothetical protein
VPWLKFGGGYYKRTLQLTQTALFYYPPIWDPWWGWIDGGWGPGEAIVGQRDNAGLGLTVGAGIDFEIDSGASLFLESRYEHAFNFDVCFRPSAGMRWVVAAMKDLALGHTAGSSARWWSCFSCCSWDRRMGHVRLASELVSGSPRAWRGHLQRSPRSPARALQLLHEVFGSFLLILIGLELMKTVVMYLDRHELHVEVVFTVAMIAIARHAIDLNLAQTPPLLLVGMAALIEGLSLGYYIFQKSGWFTARKDLAGVCRRGTVRIGPDLIRRALASAWTRSHLFDLPQQELMIESGRYQLSLAHVASAHVPAHRARGHVEMGNPHAPTRRAIRRGARDCCWSSRCRSQRCRQRWLDVTAALGQLGTHPELQAPVLGLETEKGGRQEVVRWHVHRAREVVEESRRQAPGKRLVRTQAHDVGAVEAQSEPRDLAPVAGREGAGEIASAELLLRRGWSPSGGNGGQAEHDPNQSMTELHVHPPTVRFPYTSSWNMSRRRP